MAGARRARSRPRSRRGRRPSALAVGVLGVGAIAVELHVEREARGEVGDAEGRVAALREQHVGARRTAREARTTHPCSRRTVVERGRAEHRPVAVDEPRAQLLDEAARRRRIVHRHDRVHRGVARRADRRRWCAALATREEESAAEQRAQRPNNRPATRTPPCVHVRTPSNQPGAPYALRDGGSSGKAGKRGCSSGPSAPDL